MATILEDRLARVLAMPLQPGSHPSVEKGLCVMEAVAYVAGEPAAAGAAAGAAARQALTPVEAALIVSAVELVERMLAVTPESLSA
jgi:hypothetical protein